jgi:hypothetical protein
MRNQKGRFVVVVNVVDVTLAVVIVVLKVRNSAL